MTTIVEATFDGRVFRPKTRVELAADTDVQLEIRPVVRPEVIGGHGSQRPRIAADSAKALTGEEMRSALTRVTIPSPASLPLKSEPDENVIS